MTTDEAVRKCAARIWNEGRPIGHLPSIDAIIRETLADVIDKAERFDCITCAVDRLRYRLAAIDERKA